jgi:hypothetical protein
MTEPPHSTPAFGLSIPPDLAAGVWANIAIVSHSEHEFTLDFVRRDPYNPGTGILVARIAGSAAFVNQLIETLDNNLDIYAKKVLPKEIYDDGEGRDQGSGEEV